MLTLENLSSSRREEHESRVSELYRRLTDDLGYPVESIRREDVVEVVPAESDRDDWDFTVSAVTKLTAEHVSVTHYCVTEKGWRKEDAPYSFLLALRQQEQADAEAAEAAKATKAAEEAAEAAKAAAVFHAVAHLFQPQHEERVAEAIAEIGKLGYTPEEIRRENEGNIAPEFRDSGIIWEVGLKTILSTANGAVRKGVTSYRSFWGNETPKSVFNLLGEVAR
jgi:hypothetical protein